MKTIIRLLIISSLVLPQISIAQWVQTSLDSIQVWAFAVSGPNLFAGTDGGVFLSTNNGTNWTQTSLDSMTVYAFAVSGENLFAGTWGSNGMVFLSTNIGATWSAVSTGLPHYPKHSIGSIARAVSAKRGGSRINTLAVTPNGTGGMNLFAAYDCGIVGAYPCDGVYLSTNNGTNWTQTSLDNMEISTMVVSGKDLFAGTYFDGIFCSTDNGKSWTAVNNGLTNSEIYALAASGTNLFAGGGGGIYLSTNNGTSWSVVNSGLANGVYQLAFSGTNLFALREVYDYSVWQSYSGIFLSTNNGINWTQPNTGLKSLDISVIAVSGSNLFAGSWGVWRRPLSEMVSVEQSSSELPENYSLSQNYPNPFNPSTTIEYTIPQQSQVTLKIFDILGREVALLVNERKDAGRYLVQWDASAMASGMYFYQLSTNGRQQNRKAIVMK